MSPCFQTDPLSPYYADISGSRYATKADCDNHCSEVGACCRDNACSQETRCQCTQNGGAFQGLGVSCANAPCPCVIKTIESIEVTITAEDRSVENVCQFSPIRTCGALQNGHAHSSFFPGASYAGTYSLTETGYPGNWRYVFAQSGQVCGGYIEAQHNGGSIGLTIRVYGISFHDYFSTTTKPASSLTCELLSPTVNQVGIHCTIVQPYSQNHCVGSVYYSLPCVYGQSIANTSALPFCSYPAASCTSSSDEKTGVDGQAIAECGVDFSSICITSVNITYAE